MSAMTAFATGGVTFSWHSLTAARLQLDEVVAESDLYVVDIGSSCGGGAASGAALKLRWVTVLYFRGGSWPFGELPAPTRYTCRRGTSALVEARVSVTPVPGLRLCRVAEMPRLELASAAGEYSDAPSRRTRRSHRSPMRRRRRPRPWCLQSFQTAMT